MINYYLIKRKSVSFEPDRNYVFLPLSEWPFEMMDYIDEIIETRMYYSSEGTKGYVSDIYDEGSKGVYLLGCKSTIEDMYKCGVGNMVKFELDPIKDQDDVIENWIYLMD